MSPFSLRLLPAMQGMSNTVSDRCKYFHHAMLIRCKFWMLVTFLFAINSPLTTVAQVSPPVLKERISKTWQMEKLVLGNKVTSGEQGEGAFLLILHADHKVEQGLYPDGLIKGTWSVDEEKRLLSIMDNETAVVYRMRVITVTDEELVLQEYDGGNGATIYYKAR